MTQMIRARDEGIKDIREEANKRQKEFINFKATHESRLTGIENTLAFMSSLMESINAILKGATQLPVVAPTDQTSTLVPVSTQQLQHEHTDTTVTKLFPGELPPGDPS